MPGCFPEGAGESGVTLWAVNPSTAFGVLERICKSSLVKPGTRQEVQAFHRVSAPKFLVGKVLLHQLLCLAILATHLQHYCESKNDWELMSSSPSRRASSQARRKAASVSTRQPFAGAERGARMASIPTPAACAPAVPKSGAAFPKHWSDERRHRRGHLAPEIAGPLS